MEDFFPDYLRQNIRAVKLAENKSKGQVVCSCGCEEFDYNYLFFKYLPSEEYNKMAEIHVLAQEMSEKRIGPYKQYKHKEDRDIPIAVWTCCKFDGKWYNIYHLDSFRLLKVHSEYKSLEDYIKDPDYIAHFEKPPYDPNEPTEYQYIYAKCKHCGKEILLFDDRYYGYDAMCMRYEQPNKPYRTDSKLKMKKPHCESAGYKIYVTIDSTGKEDLLEGADPEFINDKNWKDAFEWIKIDLECAKCGKKKNALNLETM